MWWRPWRGGRGRPPKPRRLAWFPPGGGVAFIPVPLEAMTSVHVEPVVLYPDEVEALRLVYVEGLTQEEASRRMGVSRGTLWRLLDSGRRKLALAVVARRPIIIMPGSPHD